MNSVYIHRRADNGEIFYIGTGVKDRPYQMDGRNKSWKAVVKDVGYKVEIVEEGLEIDYALMLEARLIHQLKDSKFLTNKSPGNINKFPIYGITMGKNLIVMCGEDDVIGRGFNLDCISSSIKGSYKYDDSYMAIKWHRCLDEASLNHLIDLNHEIENNKEAFFFHKYQCGMDREKFNAIINDERLKALINYKIRSV